MGPGRVDAQPVLRCKCVSLEVLIACSSECLKTAPPARQTLQASDGMPIGAKKVLIACSGAGRGRVT